MKLAVHWYDPELEPDGLYGTFLDGSGGTFCTVARIREGSGGPFHTFGVLDPNGSPLGIIRATFGKRAGMTAGLELSSQMDWTRCAIQCEGRPKAHLDLFRKRPEAPGGLDAEPEETGCQPLERMVDIEEFLDMDDEALESAACGRSPVVCDRMLSVSLYDQPLMDIYELSAVLTDDRMQDCELDIMGSASPLTCVAIATVASLYEKVRPLSPQDVPRLFEPGS